jgi:hypothetical protein
MPTKTAAGTCKAAFHQSRRRFRHRSVRVRGSIGIDQSASAAVLAQSTHQAANSVDGAMRFSSRGREVRQTTAATKRKELLLVVLRPVEAQGGVAARDVILVSWHERTAHAAANWRHRFIRKRCGRKKYCEDETEIHFASASRAADFLKFHDKLIPKKV